VFFVAQKLRRYVSGLNAKQDKIEEETQAALLLDPE
jgi:hypothetical protein